jgi:MFS family permease
MDSSIVNVALPTMRRDLHLSTSGQQWVVDAYLLTLGGFLLLGARVADPYGRKLTFQAGLVVSALASLVGGLAVNGPMLLAARAVQGVGGAVLAPAGLGPIIANHHHPLARAKAMSLYLAAVSVAAAAGVLLGGVLTQDASWPSVMFVNVPVGFGLFLAVTASLVPATAGGSRARLDVAGSFAVTIGVGALIYGLSEATADGWGSGAVLAQKLEWPSRLCDSACSASTAYASAMWSWPGSALRHGFDFLRVTYPPIRRRLRRFAYRPGNGPAPRRVGRDLN